MAQEFDPPKSSAKKLSITSDPSPSCQQLAELFFELQQLRQEVREAEAERWAGARQLMARN
jgi:hypothetical protein